MNKIFLGSLVGGIILFGWQSVSWTAMGIHDSAFRYTPAQDSLAGALKNSFSEPGNYMVPMPADGTTEDEKEAFRKSMEGKPWAIISYHDYYEPDMLGPIIKGFLVSLICVIILCLNINQFQRPKFGKILITAMSYGLVSFLFISYTDHIWFDTHWAVLRGIFIDSIVGWGLCGIWLGLWYSRK